MCSICFKKFQTLHAKNGHEKQHALTNLNNVCPSCGKCYKNHQDLMKQCRSKNHEYPEKDIYPENKIQMSMKTLNNFNVTNVEQCRGAFSVLDINSEVI